MYIDSYVGVRTVDDRGAAVHARADSVIAGPGHHHPRASADEVGAQVSRHVEVVPRLGGAAVGFRAGGVAGLPFPAVPDQVVGVLAAGVLAAGVLAAALAPQADVIRPI